MQPFVKLKGRLISDPCGRETLVPVLPHAGSANSERKE